MLEEYMEFSRNLTEKEEKLLTSLIEKSKLSIPKNWRKNLLVSPMDDGGMGSLYLYYKDKNNEKRTFGYQISDMLFTDVDGVAVLASLNVDQNGNLYELDLWKTDNSKLIDIPDSIE